MSPKSDRHFPPGPSKLPFEGECLISLKCVTRQFWKTASVGPKSQINSPQLCKTL
jgi:hypothetical protein